MSLNSFRNGMGHLASSPAGKWALFTVGGVLVFSLVYSGLGNNLGGGGAGPAGPSSADTVATVNGESVTRAEFDQVADSFRQQSQMMGQAISPDKVALLNSASLDRITTAKLALQRAEKMGLTASDKEITQERERAVTQDDLRKQLSLPATASLSDVNDALAKAGAPPLEQESRYSDDTLREKIILDKLQASFSKPATDQDAQAYYKEYHTRHILIDNKKVSDVQAQSQAQQILAKVNAPGADFAALARQYSDDPGTKPKGGDDGWIGEDNNYHGYIPEFTKAVTALKPGEVTPVPVKTPEFGYFLIKLEGIRENLPPDFSKNKAKYLGTIKDQRQQTAEQAFQADIKNDPANKIVVNDPGLRGDQELAQSQQGDPTQRPAKLNAAVADLTTALKNVTAGQAGEINAALALAYQGLNQPQKALAAEKAAVDVTHDQDLEMALGNIYLQNKDTTNAITQFQAASAQAWNDPQVHRNLIITYATMKRPDLAAKERLLYQQIQKRQQASATPFAGASPGAPGGASTPIVIPPAGTGGHAGAITIKAPAGAGAHAGAITVKSASGRPAAPAPTPGQ